MNPSALTAAYARIQPWVRRTPVMDVHLTDYGVARPVSLKLELLQHTGSFKPRGAFNNLLSADELPAVGVAAASGGNHGAAVAFAARRLGVPAHIFVPEICAPPKRARIADYGATLHVGGARYADALERCDAFVADSGALSVHAYDAEATIAGAGTTALEWERQVADLDAVLVAVGGAGLISGFCAWFGRRTKIIGVEPVGSRALHAALEAGRPVDVEVESVAGDSLGARRIGALNYDLCKAFVDEVVLVEDDAIEAAMRVLWRRFNLATEPGGAAAFAALLSGYQPAPDERVGVLVCGSNVELTKLARICDQTASE